MTMQKRNYMEKDLYLPLERYFTALGYKVNGEINGCDLVAEQDGHLIVVEMKLALNLELILQGSERQKIADQVYIAYLKPKPFKHTQRLKRIIGLLKRLEMGLLLVNPEGQQREVEVVLEAKPYDREQARARYKRHKNQIVHELHKRQAKTIGGVTGTKIMTAYREDAISVAECIESHGPLSIKEMEVALAALMDGKRLRSILTKNYYGWFIRVERGIYGIGDNWRQDL